MKFIFWNQFVTNDIFSFFEKNPNSPTMNTNNNYFVLIMGQVLNDACSFIIRNYMRSGLKLGKTKCVFGVFTSTMWILQDTILNQFFCLQSSFFHLCTHGLESNCYSYLANVSIHTQTICCRQSRNWMQLELQCRIPKCV